MFFITTLLLCPNLNFPLKSFNLFNFEKSSHHFFHLFHPTSTQKKKSAEPLKVSFISLLANIPLKSKDESHLTQMVLADMAVALQKHCRDPKTLPQNLWPKDETPVYMCFESLTPSQVIAKNFQGKLLDSYNKSNVTCIHILVNWLMAWSGNRHSYTRTVFLQLTLQGLGKTGTSPIRSFD